jgi:pseudouridine-5'-phosphate glycosidase
VPEEDAVDAATMNAAIANALKQAEQRGATGPEVTPIVLAEIAHETSGEAVRANLSLAHNNARLAAEIATRLAVASR